MTRISQSDQVLHLLREQLQKLGRVKPGATGKAARKDGHTAPPLARAQAMGALDDMPEEEFRRTLVRALITQELSDGIANDSAFQAIADEVFRIISDTPDGRAQIDRAALQLRGGG